MKWASWKIQMAVIWKIRFWQYQRRQKVCIFQNCRIFQDSKKSKTKIEKNIPYYVACRTWIEQVVVVRLDRNIHDDDEVSNNSRSRALHAGRGSAALVWKQAWLALLLLSVPLQCYFAAAAIGRWPLATRIDRIQRVARTKYGIKCYLHFCFPLFFAKDSSILLIINMACIFFLDFNLKKMSDNLQIRSSNDDGSIEEESNDRVCTGLQRCKKFEFCRREGSLQVEVTTDEIFKLYERAKDYHRKGDKENAYSLLKNLLPFFTSDPAYWIRVTELEIDYIYGVTFRLENTRKMMISGRLGEYVGRKQKC